MQKGEKSPADILVLSLKNEEEKIEECEYTSEYKSGNKITSTVFPLIFEKG